MQTTLVTTYRHRCTHDYLDIFLKYAAQMQQVHQIIIVNQDNKTLDINHPKVFIAETGHVNMFSRSWGMNIGIRFATTEYITSVDTDTILHAEMVALDIQQLSHSEKTFIVHPYCFTNKKDTHVALNETLPWDERITCNTYPSEGCITIKAKYLNQIKGYNELLIGWGYEDNDLCNRLTDIGLSKVYPSNDNRRIPIHIDHPRPTDTEGNNPNRHAINKNISSKSVYTGHIWGEIAHPPDIQSIHMLEGSAK